MSWSRPAFEDLARLVGERTGLTFGARAGSVELGMRRAMVRAGLTDPAQYLERIAGDERALDDLVSELTIGETYFFREPEQFQRVRREVLPEVRGRRGPEHVVRAWSAGCASGEEAYSLAILFQEEGLGDRYHLLATDISQKALTQARRGVYGAWSLRGENGTDALPYLTKTGASFRIGDAIRRRVTFESLNLALDVYPSFINGSWGMDLILCRNVLIYFDATTVRNVAKRLYQSLSDGGWLITASADPPLWELVPFEVVATNQGVIYRRGIRSQESGVVGQEKTGDDGYRFQGPVVPWEASAPESEPLPAYRALDLSEMVHFLGQGEYARVVALTRHADTLEAALEVRALANLDPSRSLTACAELLVRFPLSTELSYLQAVLLLDQGRTEEAIRSVRNVIYLDRSLAIAHFTLASLLRRRGDLAGARRCLRNARDLAAGRPAQEPLPLGDGEKAGRLAEVAGAELVFLEEASP